MRRLYSTSILTMACLLGLLMQNHAQAAPPPRAPPRSDIAGPTTQQLGLKPNPGDPTAPPAGTPGSGDLTGLSTDRLMVGSKHTSMEDPEAAKRAREAALRDAAAAPKNDILGFSTVELSLAALVVVAVVAALFFAFRRRE